MLAKELPTSQFLRLAILGSSKTPATGRRLILDPKKCKIMTVIATCLSVIFLVVFVTGLIKLSWPNVTRFLIAVAGTYVAAMRSGKFVEKAT